MPPAKKLAAGLGAVKAGGGKRHPPGDLKYQQVEIARTSRSKRRQREDDSSHFKSAIDIPLWPPIVNLLAAPSKIHAVISTDQLKRLTLASLALKISLLAV